MHGETKNSFDLPYCNTHFAEVVWNGTSYLYEVCLYNSQTVQFTHFKCLSIKFNDFFHKSTKLCKHHQKPSFKHFYHPTKILHTCLTHPTPATSNHKPVFFLSKFALSGHFTRVGSHNIQSPVSIFILHVFGVHPCRIHSSHLLTAD